MKMSNFFTISLCLAIFASCITLAVTANDEQFEISLYEGWNLITVPVETNMMASDLAENITDCQAVSKWDAAEQTHKTYIVDGPSAFDFSIEPGIGYYIDVKSNSSLTVTGTVIENVEIPMVVGTNLVGWYENDPTTASAIYESIPGCVSVIIFDAVNQIYIYYNGSTDDDFAINQNMGYFVILENQDEGLELLVETGVGKVIANIHNFGEVNISNIKWSISVKGGILKGINVSNNGTIDVIKVGEYVDVDTRYSILGSRIFGLGKISITVDVSYELEGEGPIVNTVKQDAFVIGSFIIKT